MNLKQNIELKLSFARILGKLGYSYMYQNNAITAEGLLRSSLDKFRGSSEDDRFELNVLIFFFQYL